MYKTIFKSLLAHSIEFNCITSMFGLYNNKIKVNSFIVGTEAVDDDSLASGFVRKSVIKNGQFRGIWIVGVTIIMIKTPLKLYTQYSS